MTQVTDPNCQTWSVCLWCSWCLRWRLSHWQSCSVQDHLVFHVTEVFTFRDGNLSAWRSAWSSPFLRADDLFRSSFRYCWCAYRCMYCRRDDATPDSLCKQGTIPFIAVASQAPPLTNTSAKQSRWDAGVQSRSTPLSSTCPKLNSL